MPTTKTELIFQAAVERPLSVVFRRKDGIWEGHDYQVQVVAQRKGLDACDVVMDFRALEAALDARLAPLNGRLLSDVGIADPAELAWKLLEELASSVPAPAFLSEVVLQDGRGRRIQVRSN
jgi:hypothetical protein